MKAQLVGIFVGGESLRMGTPKGLLRAPDGSGLSLVGRTALLAQKVFPGSRQVLVGVRPEYAEFPLPALRDAAPASGPLGGLVALLREASRLELPFAIALGCDFPYLDVSLLERLSEADQGHEIVAPKAFGHYQPLVARYKSTLLEPFEQALQTRRLALQPLLLEHHAFAPNLGPGDEEKLRDWDEPADLEG